MLTREQLELDVLRVMPEVGTMYNRDMVISDCGATNESDRQLAKSVINRYLCNGTMQGFKSRDDSTQLLLVRLK